MKKVYKLHYDFNHLMDADFDSFHIEFENSKMIGANMISTRNFELPEKIYFQANFNIISNYDYPITDLGIPIMSKRMINILFKIKSFKFREIPIVMIDDTFMGDLFNSDGKLVTNVVTNNNFIAVQLMETCIAFDYKNSVYEEDFILPVGYIKKLILQEPENGFPSLFKIEESLADMFISEEAKNALEKQNIKGCIFEEVEVSQN